MNIPTVSHTVQLFYVVLSCALCCQFDVIPTVIRGMFAFIIVDAIVWRHRGCATKTKWFIVEYFFVVDDTFVGSVVVYFSIVACHRRLLRRRGR